MILLPAIHSAILKEWNFKVMCASVNKIPHVPFSFVDCITVLSLYIELCFKIVDFYGSEFLSNRCVYAGLNDILLNMARIMTGR
jgi:hypothetical protein